MIDATELFDRTDRAFAGLRDLSEKAMDRAGVTTEWARLHAKGTAVANANAVFRTSFSDVTDADVHSAIAVAQTTLDALIAAAHEEIVEVEEGEEDAVTAFRNAIAEGHADGYKVARDYLKQEVAYFRNV